jgi:putative PIN family toxin of toxin-antitoxin system
MRVVVDTNVLVSGLINVEGLPAQIINLVINGRLTLLYDTRILKEYEDVLGRRKFDFKKSATTPILDYFRNEGEYVTAEPTSKAFADSDDKMFYEVARTASARCLITGNKDHFPKDPIVRSPKEFIQLYLAEIDEREHEAP